MALIIYTFALFVVLALGLPYWLLAMATNGKYREGLSERLGWVPDRLREGDPRKTIWVHAVSVGEVLAASRLVNELSACAPQYRVLLSTTTRTGQRLARERTGVNHTFYFPLDFPWIVRRYLRALDPVLLVLVETELWPNLLTACRRAAIPVAVVNGRISDRSLPRYLRLRSVWKEILAGVSIVLAQSEEDVKRLKAIGAPAGRVSFAGNLKFDVRSAEPAAITTTLREKLAPRNPGTGVRQHARGRRRDPARCFSAIAQNHPGLRHDSCPAPSGALRAGGPAAEEPESAECAPFQLDEASGKDKTRHRDSAGFDRRAGVGVCAGLGRVRGWEPGSGWRP